MADLPATGQDGPVDIASISLSASLGYLDLRFAGKWQQGRDALVQWQEQFDAAHPELAALKPHG